MNVTIIIPVLESREVLRRQILFWEGMNLPDDVEILIMDDGSDPPLEFDTDVVTIRQTNEKRPWTSSIARNRGAVIAKGRNLIMADVDYIIPKDLIMEVREFTGEKMAFRREFGVLDKEGRFHNDRETLLAYGLLPRWYDVRKAKIPHHHNVYAMNREVFREIGGYNERMVLTKQYPQGEDNFFKRTWHKWAKAKGWTVATGNSPVYMFPVGQFCGDIDFNPHGLFHDLTRKTESNVFWQRQKKGRYA